MADQKEATTSGSLMHHSKNLNHSDTDPQEKDLPEDIPPPPPLTRQDHYTIYEDLLTLEQRDKFCVFADTVVIGVFDTMQEAIEAQKTNWNGVSGVSRVSTFVLAPRSKR
jgi:hypothetical protein